MVWENIFCDRDGTIIYDKHYLGRPEEVELIPGSISGLRRLQDVGGKIFVVTNQSGIGRGLYSEDDYQACEDRLGTLLEAQGVKVVATEHCPHMFVDEGAAFCQCRKPATGMWESLRARYGLVPEKSCMIGDKQEDIMFGKNAGFGRTVLVLTGKGEAAAAALDLPTLEAGQRWLIVPAPVGSRPDCLAKDLDAAADFLLLERHE
jgi:D-glycero-D-manno-heptose 1,7-bisphosphate phosphatase